MKKEVFNHKAHLEITFERLIAVLFMPQELDLIYSDKDHCAEHLSSRYSWVTVDKLVVPGVTTEEMVLLHLLWLQSIGRVIIEDIDPASSAVLLHLNIPANTKDDALSS